MVEESDDIPNPFSSKEFRVKYSALDPKGGAFRDVIVNTKLNGSDKPFDDVTVRVLVGEKIEQEMLDRLVQAKLVV